LTHYDPRIHYEPGTHSAHSFPALPAVLRRHRDVHTRAGDSAFAGPRSPAPLTPGGASSSGRVTLTRCSYTIGSTQHSRLRICKLATRRSLPFACSPQRQRNSGDCGTPRPQHTAVRTLAQRYSGGRQGSPCLGAMVWLHSPPLLSARAIPEGIEGGAEGGRLAGACFLVHGGQGYRELEDALGCWPYQRDKITMIRGSMPRVRDATKSLRRTAALTTTARGGAPIIS
jgi:hypothetical protein